MKTELRNDADYIVSESIKRVLPDEAVRRALKNMHFSGRIFLLAVGKAGWQMAKAASECIGDRLSAGMVITKYGHAKSDLPNIKIYEAGHPVPDENGFEATRKAIDMVRGLEPDDTVILLLSGGGSALFELPLISGNELLDITNQLLACGADIVEINTIRKRLSGVKGGKFAGLCAPANVYTIILSDIVGDPVDMIASGPTCADSSTCEDAKKIVEKYGLKLSYQAEELLNQETPKNVGNVRVEVTGSVKELCFAAKEACIKLGYKPYILTDELNCQAREAGLFLSSIVKSHYDDKENLAFIAGGETVVTLTGNGKGGRNQELALSAASGIDGLEGTAVFSVGSDGTDGPTDAAGGYVDSHTLNELVSAGVNIYSCLKDNDAYHALKKIGGLIMTGPTGTNVNDVSVALIKNAGN